MNHERSPFDEKWGTDYEGLIGISGICFYALNEHPILGLRQSAVLRGFQQSLPDDILGFVYEAPKHAREWLLDVPGTVIASQRIELESKGPLLIIVVLGPRYRLARDTLAGVVPDIMSKARSFLNAGGLPSSEVMVIHVNALKALTVGMSFGETPSPHHFYRLR